MDMVQVVNDKFDIVEIPTAADDHSHVNIYEIPRLP